MGVDNDFHLQKFRFKYDMRKFCFNNRVVDTWNSLPNWVVSANNIKTFKDLATLATSRYYIRSSSPN